jgi:hypothetical protein
MAQEPRTRFTWTWAGILAGVVLGGASYGSWRPAEASRRGAPEREPAVRLAQVDPTGTGTGSSTGTAPLPGQQTTPGVSPTPGTAQTPYVTGTDAGTGVGGSGFAPPSTAYTGQDAGYGSPSILTPGSGVGGSGGIPSVGGADGGMGF